METREVEGSASLGGGRDTDAQGPSVGHCQRLVDDGRSLRCNISTRGKRASAEAPRLPFIRSREAIRRRPTAPQPLHSEECVLPLTTPSLASDARPPDPVEHFLPLKIRDPPAPGLGQKRHLPLDLLVKAVPTTTR